VVVTFQANGDRLPDGTIGPATGAVLDLTNYQGTTYTGSWATCTVDADGDCSFVIPAADAASMTILTVAVEAPWEDASLSTQTVYVYGATGGQSFTANAPLALERINPTLPKDCGNNGLNVAIDVDLSGSMYPDGLPALKTDAKAYVDALTGTNSSIALYTFATDAPAAGPGNVNRPLTSVQTAAGAAQVKGWIDGWDTDVFTNWDAGLFQVAQSSDHYDFVIFITDGLPTSARNDNIASANALKAKGTRIIVVTTASGFVASSVTNISGLVTGDADVAKNDYFQSDWADVGTLLNTLATAICPAMQTLPTTRTVHYTGAGTSTPKDSVSTIVWTMTTDPATGDTTYTADPAEYPAVASPSVAGYTPDQATVAASSVTTTTTKPTSSTVTVTYTAVPKPATGTVNVTYVDNVTGKQVAPKKGATVAWTGDDGTSGVPTDADAKAGVPDGYAIASIDNKVTKYDAKAPQTITVYLTHQTTTTTVRTTRTVHYTGAGTLTPPDAVSTVVWTAVLDQVTKKTTYTTKSSAYPAVSSPSVDNFAPDKAKVAALAVTTPTTAAPASSKVVVTYAPSGMVATGGIPMLTTTNAGVIAFAILCVVMAVTVRRRARES